MKIVFAMLMLASVSYGQQATARWEIETNYGSDIYSHRTQPYKGQGYNYWPIEETATNGFQDVVVTSNLCIHVKDGTNEYSAAIVRNTITNWTDLVTLKSNVIVGRRQPTPSELQKAGLR